MFLSDGPAGDRSITSRVAYWAGGVDPKERGEPVIIRVKGLSELAEGVQKAACVQAMDERGQHGIPMAAPVDPSHLRPLLRGLPDTLKIHVESLGERIQGTIERNRRAPQNPEQVLTWGEALHRRVTYGREMGWSDPGGGPDGNKRVWQSIRNSLSKQTPSPTPRQTEPSRRKSEKAHDLERNDLWRKALALGAPRTMLHGQPTSHIHWLVTLLEGKDKGPGSKEVTAPPHHPTANPFAPLQEELNKLKN